MSQLQFIGTTPEEANRPVIDEIRNGFKNLINEFQPKQPEEFLTLEETAKFLKIDKSSVHNWRKRGIIKAYQIGHRVYTKRSEIEEAIQPLNK